MVHPSAGDTLLQLRRPLGAQQQARRDELHHHYDAAAEPMSQLHDRQPAILAPDAYDAWLDPSIPATEVKPLLQQNLDGGLQFYRVDRKVNSSSRTDKPNDDASMVVPSA